MQRRRTCKVDHDATACVEAVEGISGTRAGPRHADECASVLVVGERMRCEVRRGTTEWRHHAEATHGIAYSDVDRGPEGTEIDDVIRGDATSTREIEQSDWPALDRLEVQGHAASTEGQHRAIHCGELHQSKAMGGIHLQRRCVGVGERAEYQEVLPDRYIAYVHGRDRLFDLVDHSAAAQGHSRGVAEGHALATAIERGATQGDDVAVAARDYTLCGIECATGRAGARQHPIDDEVVGSEVELTVHEYGSGGAGHLHCEQAGA